MLTRIEHPCVQGGRVGLDFLVLKVDKAKASSRAPAKNSDRYRMWSPAYTVTSILTQLQGSYLTHPPPEGNLCGILPSNPLIISQAKSWNSRHANWFC